MSQDAKDAMGYSIAALFVIISICAGLWLGGKLIGGIGNWWHSINYVSPEEKTRRAEYWAIQEAEWAKDPRNPKVAGQKCLDLGGVPDYSAWDGDVKECRGIGNKSVNIEVNQ